MPLEDAAIQKIHSAVRWGKPVPEIEAAVKDVGATMADAVTAVDPKNGNLATHIAAQNGHQEILKFLLDNKADVNSQNGKGQTPLHMSVEYDFYFQSKYLLDQGADKEKTNGDGNKAIEGIDGGKKGTDAWDNPVNILKAAADDKGQLDQAFDALEKASADQIDKAILVQAGMMKKKNAPNNWDHKRFMACVQKF